MTHFRMSRSLLHFRIFILLPLLSLLFLFSSILLHNRLPIPRPHSTGWLYIYGSSSLSWPSHLYPSSCDASMFSTESMIHQRMLNLSPDIRTYDPEAAKLLFVPLYSTCLMLQAASSSRNPHIIQRAAIQEAIELLEEQPRYKFWSRRAAADHIWVLSHDFGACLSHRDRSGDAKVLRRLRNSVVLSPHGDRSSNCYFPSRNIVIPPAIIEDELVQMGKILDLAGTQEIYRERPMLAFFRGTVQWKWNGKIDPMYSHGIRQELFRVLGQGDSRIKVLEGHARSKSEYFRELGNATFCLCPRGYATWSPRLVHSIIAGCIPVIIGADVTDHPWQKFLNYSEFAVNVNGGRDSVALIESSLVKLAENKKKITTMRKKLREIWTSFLFQQVYPNRDSAFDLLLKELSAYTDSIMK